MAVTSLSKKKLVRTSLLHKTKRNSMAVTSLSKKKLVRTSLLHKTNRNSMALDFNKGGCVKQIRVD